jgi:hypothetical protein
MCRTTTPTSWWRWRRPPTAATASARRASAASCRPRRQGGRLRGGGAGRRGRMTHHAGAASCVPDGGGLRVTVAPAYAHRDHWQPAGRHPRAAVQRPAVHAQIERTAWLPRAAQRPAHRGAGAEPRAAELLRVMPYKAPPDLSRSCSRRCRACWSTSRCSPGQAVQAGERLAVIEAMKMENILTAHADGVVAECWPARARAWRRPAHPELRVGPSASSASSRSPSAARQAAPEALWVDMLGPAGAGTFVSERENVDEDICALGKGATASRST